MSIASLSLQQFIQILNKSRDKLFKVAQYVCLLISYYHENRDHKAERYDYFFKYKNIFNIRRLFRIGHFITFIPSIKANLNALKESFSAETLFLTLSNIFKCIFYLIDNAAIIMSLTLDSRYYIARRVSFSIFFVSLLATLIHSLIVLKQNYNQEKRLKSPVDAGILPPTQFLAKIQDLDSKRFKIKLDIASCLGDLIPTLQRTNLNQVLIKTRMNKGTVGWSGLIAAICQVITLHLK